MFATVEQFPTAQSSHLLEMVKEAEVFVPAGSKTQTDEKSEEDENVTQFFN